MRHFLLILAAMVLATHGRAAESTRIDKAGTNWASGGRAFDEQHFSPLNQITAENVQKLGLAWSLDLPGEHSLEATPLAVDGVIYFPGQMSKIYAVDAVTGKLLWTYDPEVYLRRQRVQRYLFPVNRGLAYWNGKVFVGARDGRLIAVDAKTGKLVWSTMTLDEKSVRMISGAPRAFNGKVLIGNNGGDQGERGYITAYDTESGKQLWRFYTAPGSPEENKGDPVMEMAAKTWSGEWWKTGTGGTVWDSFTYDPELNRVYIGGGNSWPYDPEQRSPGGGDNLFIASIIAVDADTGKYIWHYQVNPRESWDWKATQNIVLTTLKIDGRDRRVLMQSPTNGFFYVIDRDTGKLISAEKTGKVTWAERIDLTTGRPVEAPNIRYQNGPIVMWPSLHGTHNWMPMSFNPQTGLVYIPYMQASSRYELLPRQKADASGVEAFNSGGTSSTIKNDPDDGTGQLLAWDPVAQKPRWSVRRERMWNGGTATTAGNLVFQGDAEGIFHAYDARNGKSLWSYDAKLGIIGAPITFMAGGKQYVSVLVGFGGGSILLSGAFGNYGWKYGAQPRRLLTFAIGSRAALPPTPPRDFKLYPKDNPKFAIDEAAAKNGKTLYYGKFCSSCHGFDTDSNGAPGPDLRESAIATDYATFAEFIRSGDRVELGMPKFDEITDEEARALFMYVRSAARAATKSPRAAGKSDDF